MPKRLINVTRILLEMDCDVNGCDMIITPTHGQPFCYFYICARLSLCGQSVAALWTASRFSRDTLFFEIKILCSWCDLEDGVFVSEHSQMCHIIFDLKTSSSEKVENLCEIYIKSKNVDEIPDK